LFKKAYLQALHRKQLPDLNEFGAVFCCFKKERGGLDILQPAHYTLSEKIGGRCKIPPDVFTQNWLFTH